MKRLTLFFVTAMCMFLLSLPSLALESRASNQINSYSIEVTPVVNSINVNFSVSGNVVMSKLGCENIEVYEKSGSRWISAESWYEDDTGMSRTRTRSHKNTIYCDGDAGVEYKVVVTVFAENSEGRDTRTKTFYVTGK